MPHNRPLTLQVANRKAFALLFLFLFVLVVLSAVLSSYTLPLIFLAFLVFGANSLTSILDFYKVNDVELVSFIFPDGRVRLESNHHPEIECYMDGQQWCTHHVAVLQYITGGKRQYLVLFSAHQNADDYRRLNVWLRQDYCTGAAEKRGSGNRPASRV